ncbi:MAG: hypothetical protein WC758_08300 [Candidatus Woesearchaeota archaeon]|jgi:hypothetical protein
MGNSRGQVTIFVILGIVLVIVLVFALFIIKNINSNKDNVALREAYKGMDFSSYTDYYVKTCMEDYSKETAYLLVDSAFINITKEKTILVGIKRVPLLVDGQKSNLMTIEQSQNYYEFLFNSFMKECLSKIDDEVGSDFTITLGEPSSNVEFYQTLILINLTYPISATNSKQTIKKESFAYILDYDLNSKHNLLEVISTKQLTTIGYFQIGFVSEEIQKRNLLYEITYEGGPSKIKIFYDLNNERKMEFIIR